MAEVFDNTVLKEARKRRQAAGAKQEEVLAKAAADIQKQQKTANRMRAHAKTSEKTKARAVESVRAKPKKPALRLVGSERPRAARAPRAPKSPEASAPHAPREVRHEAEVVPFAQRPVQHQAEQAALQRVQSIFVDLTSADVHSILEDWHFALAVDGVFERLDACMQTLDSATFVAGRYAELEALFNQARVAHVMCASVASAVEADIEEMTHPSLWDRLLRKTRTQKQISEEQRFLATCRKIEAKVTEVIEKLGDKLGYTHAYAQKTDSAT